MGVALMTVLASQIQWYQCYRSSADLLYCCNPSTTALELDLFGNTQIGYDGLADDLAAAF
jgi:hypothetical protein